MKKKRIPCNDCYVRDAATICHACHAPLCAVHAYKYVGSANAAITRNSPTLCLKCYEKEHGYQYDLHIEPCPDIGRARHDRVRPAIESKKRNPMLKYGPGPAGKRCKECRHLFRHKCSVTYFKCGFRIYSHGPATDHRANWPACIKFEPLAVANLEKSDA